MFTFLINSYDAVGGAGPTVFMGFFVYVWVLWLAKSLAPKRYRPWIGPESALTTTVIVPVYNEPEPIFRRALASVVFNAPTEIVVVVDGGDGDVAAVARDYADRVIRIPKVGKREAIATGLDASNGTSDIVVVLDSDTVWEPTALAEM